MKKMLVVVAVVKIQPENWNGLLYTSIMIQKFTSAAKIYYETYILYIKLNVSNNQMYFDSQNNFA